MFLASATPFLLSLILLEGYALEINTPSELVAFSTSVNSGTNYSGTTVFLASDIVFNSTLSQQFQTIGSETNPFTGTFYGQGYTISNLKLASSATNIGLFGYSYEATIQNVVLDASCSVKGSSANDLGSICGYCTYCTIENSVNMANVTFTGNSGSNFFLGGIVSRLLNTGTVRNCANYGYITHSGNTNSGSFIGGIAGLCGGGKSSTKSIQNCANYGTITYGGRTGGTLRLGGVIGYSSTGAISVENCLSAGRIVNSTQAEKYNLIGSVFGYIQSGTNITITHCLWTSDVECNSVCGSKETGGEPVISDSSLISTMNVATMNEMNTHAEKYSEWDKWFILHLNGGKINNDVNQETLVVTQKHFPDPVREGSKFSFWCIDNKAAECTRKYDPQTTDITGITELYAQWDVFTVTFNFGNGTKTKRSVKVGEKYGTLPGVEKKIGYSFAGWFTGEGGSGEKITEGTNVAIKKDHTLYASWTPNKYTVKFIAAGGTISGNSTKEVTYDSTYGDLPIPTRVGHGFAGWFTEEEGGTKIESTTVVKITKNTTFYAHWVADGVTVTFDAMGGSS